MGSEEDKKKERKEKLKAEAEKLGISYKELKEQKKKAKEEKKKKRAREAEKLDTSEHKDDMKRMRTWSHDEKDPEGENTKRRRTRSMDAKEEQDAVLEQKASMSPSEWRKDQHITIKGHGKYSNAKPTDMPDPFFKFTDAPFCNAILKGFEAAGFTAPTCIQAQVCTLLHVE